MTEDTGTSLVIDCTPDVSIDEILEKFADQEARCKVRTAETAQSMIDNGVVSSEREAARVIADQIGDSENTVRQRIKIDDRRDADKQ